MTESAAALLKSRLRADLTAALKAREKLQAALLRDLIAALDNAEAVPIPANECRLAAAGFSHRFGRNRAHCARPRAGARHHEA